MNELLFTKDFIIVISFLIVALLIGVFSGRTIKSFSDYTRFYKSTNPAMLGLSLTMVIFGSGTLVGAISEMYTVGIIYVLATSGYIFNSLITAKFIIPKIDRKFSGMITVSDMMGYYYGKCMEKFSAVIAVIFDVIALASQLIVIGKLLSYFFGIDYKYGLIVTGAIMITYSSLGGIRAVTIMDCIKCLMLLIFIPTLASISVHKSGGMIPVLQNTPKEFLSIFSHKDFFKYSILFFLFLMPIHMLQPIVVQRILLINNTSHASKSMYIYALIRFILLWVTATIALSIIANGYNVNPKNVLYDAIFKNVAPGFIGFVVTSLFAIVMCKADAHLNASSIIVTKNILASRNSQVINKPKYVRIITVLIGVLGLSIATLDLSIIKMIVFIETLWGISIGIPLLFALWERRNNRIVFYEILSVLSFMGLYYFFDAYIASFLGVLLSLYIMGTMCFWNHLFRNQELNLSSLIKILYCVLKNIREYLPSLSKLVSFTQKHVERVGTDYLVFSLFFGMNYSIPILMWNGHSEHLFVLATLRGLAMFFCAILLVKNFWPQKFKQYFPLYWYFVLSYSLSFIPLSNLILNAWNKEGLVDIALSILLLVLLADWLMFIATLSLGFIMSYLFCYVVLGEITFPADISTGYLVVYSFVFAILIGIIFARRKESKYDEQIRVATMFGGVVAHEMRTYLLSIKNYISGLKEHLPILTRSYYIASEQKLVSDDLTSKQLILLKHSNVNIEKIIKKSFGFIDTLLRNISGPQRLEKYNEFNISQVVSESLKTYPFTENETKIVKIECNKKTDFIVKGDKEMLSHVLHNLINNALYFLVNVKDPKILLKCQSNKNDKFNKLIVIDNGSGIAKQDLEKIFDKFFSVGKKGTGLGLSFCKIAMNVIGGDIECLSEKGKYTQFILNFPKITR